MKPISFALVLVLLPAQISQADEKPAASTLVVAISGFQSDATAAQIDATAARNSGNSGMYQLLGDLKKQGYSTKFFNWNGTPAGQFTQRDPPGPEEIVKFIRQSLEKDQKRLIVVGHSWGGHTMLEVAQRLEADPAIKIDLAVSVDGSSLSRGKRTKDLPKQIVALANYYTGNRFCWGEWKDAPQCVNISLGAEENGFVGPGKPDYGAAFNLRAHNAVEWDAAIHLAIKKRIQQASTDRVTPKLPSIKPRESEPSR